MTPGDELLYGACLVVGGLLGLLAGWAGLVACERLAAWRSRRRDAKGGTR